MNKEARANASVFGGIAATVGAYLYFGETYFPWWGYFIVFPFAMGAVYSGLTEEEANERMADRED